MNFEAVSDETLTARLIELSKRDLVLTAEIVAHIYEFESRRLYLQEGSTSIFGYLVDKLGYSKPTAQNRIDAARLLGDIPEIEIDIATGKIGLSQIAIIASGLRLAKKQDPHFSVTVDQKRQLVEKVKETAGEGRRLTEQIVAQELGIKFTPIERVRTHHDGSVTVEVTFSKEDFEVLQRTRELNSHVNYNAGLAETLAAALRFFVAKKDPLKQKVKLPAGAQDSPLHLDGVENFALQGSDPNCSDAVNIRKPSAPSKVPALPKRKYISVHTSRSIHQRDESCRWVDAKTGQVCGSKFQLQHDHIVGVRDGGSNDISNLQLLCGVHNRLKYQVENKFNELSSNPDR